MVIYRYKTFSDEDKKISLKSVKSHRGLGRSLALGYLPASLAARSTKKLANKLDEEGASEAEIIEKVGKAGGKRGAIANAATFGTLGAANGGALGLLAADALKKSTKKGAIAGSILGGVAGLSTAVPGYIAGKMGAKKNAQDRLRKRRELERDLRK